MLGTPFHLWDALTPASAVHWDAGELARSRGVATAVEGEQEYEEAPLIGNLSGSDVWRTWGENGLVRAEDGLLISPSGKYPCKDGSPCHGWHVCQNAPKWHYATNQGLARNGHFADAVTQDNAAGLIDQDDSSPGLMSRASTSQRSGAPSSATGATPGSSPGAGSMLLA